MEFVGVDGVARDYDVRPVRSAHHTVTVLVAVVLKRMNLTCLISTCPLRELNTMYHILPTNTPCAAELYHSFWRSAQSNKTCQLFHFSAASVDCMSISFGRRGSSLRKQMSLLLSCPFLFTLVVCHNMHSGYNLGEEGRAKKPPPTPFSSFTTCRPMWTREREREERRSSVAA